MDQVALFKQVDLFRDLTDAQLERIRQIADEVSFVVGETIFNQDDLADKMYIIGQGQVEVRVKHTDGNEQSVLFLGTGQVVGEMTLVDEGRRSATIIAVEDETTVLTIPNSSFTTLCENNTDIGYIIMRNIAQDMSFKLRHRGF